MTDINQFVGPQDPRDTVGIITSATTFVGFGVSSVSSLGGNGNFRLEFENTASPSANQELQLTMSSSNTTDKYIANYEIVDGNTVDIYVGFIGAGGTNRFPISVERTLL